MIRVFILCLFLMSCKNNFAVQMAEVNGTTWFYCTRYSSGLDREKLAICETVDECIAVCDTAREADKKK